VTDERFTLASYVDVVAQSTPERRAALLRCGFLPVHPEVLVDAGTHVLQLLHPEETDEEPTRSAALRLEAICLRLRLTNAPQARLALESFEARLRALRRADAFVTAGAFGVLGLGAAGLVFLFLRCR
jgi:hypothetical protein